MRALVVASPSQRSVVGPPPQNSYRISWVLIALGGLVFCVGGYVLAAKVSRLSRALHPAVWAAVMGAGATLVLIALRYLTVKAPPVQQHVFQPRRPPPPLEPVVPPPNPASSRRPPVVFRLPEQMEQASHIYQAVGIAAQDAAEQLLRSSEIREVQSEASRGKIARLATFNLIMGAADGGVDCHQNALLVVAPGIEFKQSKVGGDPLLSGPEAPVYPILAREVYEQLSKRDKQLLHNRWIAGQGQETIDMLFGSVALAIQTRFMPPLQVTNGKVECVIPAAGQESHIYDYLTRLYKKVGVELVNKFAITEDEYTLLSTFRPVLSALVVVEMLSTSQLESSADSDTLLFTRALRASFHKRNPSANFFTLAGLNLGEPVQAYHALAALKVNELAALKEYLSSLCRAKGVPRITQPSVKLLWEIGNRIGIFYFPSCAKDIYSALPFVEPLAEAVRPLLVPAVMAPVVLQPRRPNLDLLQPKYHAEVRLGGHRLPWNPPKPFTPHTFAEACRPIQGDSEKMQVRRLTQPHFYPLNNFAAWGKCLYGALAQAVFGGDHQLELPSHGGQYRKDYSESPEHIAELERMVKAHRAAHPERYGAEKDSLGWPDDSDLRALSEIFQVPIYVLYGGAGKNTAGQSMGVPMTPELDANGTLKPHVQHGDEWDAQPIRLLLQAGHYKLLRIKD